MSDSEKHLLPIGSVVTLKNSLPKPLMVYARKTSHAERRECDYLGVPYPEGFVGDEAAFCFNKEDIDRLWFVGYQTAREVELREFLENQDTPDGELWDWREY